MKRILLSSLFLVMCSFLFAQDTVMVQTFTWDSTSRSNTFTFPDYENWEKIILKYNIRCHDAAVGSGAIGCREWDYSCNTFITDSSRVDSTRLLHASHFISNFDGGVGNTFFYTNNPVYSYYDFTQHDVTYSNTNSETSAKIGNDDLPISFDGGSAITKAQFLYPGPELNAAGLTSGKITGLKLNLNQLSGSPTNFVRIKMKATDQDVLNPSEPELDGFTEVYFSNVNPASIGDYFFRFYEDFSWNGNDNILVEYSFTKPLSMGNTQMMAHQTAYTSGIVSNDSDNAIDVKGAGGVDLDVNAFSSINNEITISLWCHGIPDALPANTYAFEGYDADNKRQINVHLPWNNSRVYWDCGNDGSGADRIDKLAMEADLEGQWNHWAFTKNAATGEMKIYLNGALWHFGNAKTKAIRAIDAFKIASNIAGSTTYQGKIDEFRVWDVALDETTIADWRNRQLNNAHPNYSNLVAHYNFDEGTGLATNNLAPTGGTGTILGGTSWTNTRGKDLFKNFNGLNVRPSATFVKGSYTKNDAEITVRDSVLNTPNMVVAYGVDGSDLVVLDTQFVWDVDQSYIYDEDGNILDFNLIEEDDIISITELTYYSKAPAKYEILSLVTPYGNGLNLGPEGVTFTIDLTDYAPILHGKKRMSIEMGGQNQEEMDLKFYFHRGTPTRTVMNVQNIWPFRRGWFGDILNDKYFEPRNVNLDVQGEAFKIRSAITGHGQNGEFVQRSHYLNLDGGNRDFNYNVWKECSTIPIYPQGGTWIYDRAGWCPGDPTTVHEFDISDKVNAGGAVEIDYGLNGITMSEANYLVSNQLVTYGAPNFNLDAEVVEIIRPTSQLEYARYNPSCSTPTILIKNNGTSDITSLSIEYGEKDGTKLTYDWTGNIAFLEKESIELPVANMDFWTESALNGVFEVSLLSVNGGTDEYTKNDYVKSEFKRAKVFDRKIVLDFKTNNVPTDNAYRIVDMNGNTVFQRAGLAANTVYTDDLTLSTGCYTLQVTDSSDDGLYYWAAAGNGRGSVRIAWRHQSGILLTQQGFEPEFGRFINFDFVIPPSVSTTSIDNPQLFSVYPNPTKDNINIDLFGFGKEDFAIELISMDGRVLYTDAISNPSEEQKHLISLSDFPAGVYFVQVRSSKDVWVEKVVKE